MNKPQIELLNKQIFKAGQSKEDQGLQFVVVQTGANKEFAIDWHWFGMLNNEALNKFLQMKTKLMNLEMLHTTTLAV